MQGLRRCSNDIVPLGLSPAPTPPSPPGPPSNNPSSLSIDVAESAETRIRRLISEHPVIIFSRTSCCMCHVMKKLLATIGVHPTVIELDDDEIAALPSSSDDNNNEEQQQPCNTPPAVFIGGTCVGGLESLVALHLSGHLVPKLVQVGALWCRIRDMFAQLRTSIASDPRPATSI
ncbi:glutaredoxin-C6-like isoform X1 [Prunus avium]|uniref:Glutaredoxin-C6-like isoform X1 n=1 Tax=Prunus avium TaxID=42229 RepID=A0A6P5T8Z2_PRUAV|nr:glutaredoxin-C6-like isoform X1 [Prunus avium]XP_021823687.1 glutaredoxin-C6-like isoform X1 [Prunus avium]